MAIVNTFTKLIFGDDVYSAREKSIIDAFQAMEVTVSRGDRREMGEYLRNLGVREMIQLVSGAAAFAPQPSTGLKRDWYAVSGSAPRNRNSTVWSS